MDKLLAASSHTLLTISHFYPWFGNFDTFWAVLEHGIDCISLLPKRSLEEKSRVAVPERCSKHVPFPVFINYELRLGMN